MEIALSHSTSVYGPLQNQWMWCKKKKIEKKYTAQSNNRKLWRSQVADEVPCQPWLYFTQMLRITSCLSNLWQWWRFGFGASFSNGFVSSIWFWTEREKMCVGVGNSIFSLPWAMLNAIMNHCLRNGKVVQGNSSYTNINRISLNMRQMSLLSHSPLWTHPWYFVSILT